MEVVVRFLENLRLEACFDDFKITTDQPVRYKGDGSAPSPFDYFLASSALCAGYFVRVYCKARDIPTEDIKLSQNNIVDPENRYRQTFKIQVDLPEGISRKDRQGILRSIERCTVKKVVQQSPSFEIDVRDVLGKDDSLIRLNKKPDSNTRILGKDASLEETITNMTEIISGMGIKLEIASWRNPVPNVWSVHIRDASSPICFTNGKGATKESALCSALGEYIERLSCNYFYNDHYLGSEISDSRFVHYPEEKWFKVPEDGSLPKGLMDANLLHHYNPDGELEAKHLIDTNSGRFDRGICSIPFTRNSDKKKVYIPVNLVGNIFASNGMSAGNTLAEARVQCLSEIFERAVKNKIISQSLVLPDVPRSVLENYPKILAGIEELSQKGFPVLVKDASLGGRFPVMCVTLMNPKTGGVFASFGAHPKFEVALERSLTELLQGRSFEGLNDVPLPTFSDEAVSEPNNLVEHFIDSTGVISWKFFSKKYDYEFVDWNFSGTTLEESSYLLAIMRQLEKEVYIAEYEDFGAHACRILVPGYSEVYPGEDLVWDNTNKALDFRTDILDLHNLGQQGLVNLVCCLEESELDNYTRISELIGIEFDENTVWGQLDIGELKVLVYAALGELKKAKELVANFLKFNDNTVERNLFYQALDAALHIYLETGLEIEDYIENLTKMYGQETMHNVVGTISGEVRFFGLTETNLELEGLIKHQQLIASYKKLHAARKSQ